MSNFEQQVMMSVQDKVRDYQPAKKLKLSHSYFPFYYGNKLKSSYVDHKPELKRAFH